MVAVVVVAAFGVLLIAEAVFLWLGRLDDIRREEAYWGARARRPALYDWAEEGDL